MSTTGKRSPSGRLTVGQFRDIVHELANEVARGVTQPVKVVRLKDLDILREAAYQLAYLSASAKARFEGRNAGLKE